MKIVLKNKTMSPSNEVSYLLFEVDRSFSFKEGQFAMLSCEIDGLPIKRAYSIASTNEDAQKGEIGFYVKKASEKGMSNYLTQIIKEGDSIEMAGPYGHLINDHSFQKILLISVGSGVAPILAHYRSIYSMNKFNKVFNIFGERSYDSLINIIEDTFKDTDNMKNLLFLSREERTGFKKGYVQEGVSEALEFLGTLDIKVIICGNPQMVDSVIEILEKKGVDKVNIKSEKY